MKKINFRLVVLVIILLIVAYRFFTFKPPIAQQEDFTRLNIEYLKEKQDSKPVKKRTLHSNPNFYANPEFAEFFEDVPCKDTYLLYNYLSELKNNQGIKEETIRNFAILLAEMGLFDKARELADMLEAQSVYEKLVALLIEAGELNRAIRIADSMRMYDLKFGPGLNLSNHGIEKNYELAMEHIVSYLAKNGEIERAIEVAESIGDSMLSRIANLVESEKRKYFISNKAKSKGLSAISNVLMDNGNKEEALKIANSISDFEIKVMTLCKIATRIIKSGQKSHGIDIFQYVIDLIAKRDQEIYDINDWYKLIRNINEIAFELAKIGEIELSQQVFEKSVKICDGPDSFDSLFTIIALIKSGHYEWGIELANEFSYSWMKRWIFRDSAAELIKMNKDKEAEVFINKAIENALDSPPEDPSMAGFCPTKAEVCWEYAKALAEVDKAEPADEYFKKAIDFFKKGNNREELTDSEKENMFYDLLGAGRIEWAMEILDTISPDYNKDSAYNSLAFKFARSGEIDKSLKYLDNIQDPQEKFYTLRYISDALIEKKNYPGFEKMFPKLLECAENYSDEIERNEFYFNICQLLLGLPCEEQQKYIRKFVEAYDR